jgi:hypothetical protein
MYCINVVSSDIAFIALLIYVLFMNLLMVLIRRFCLVSLKKVMKLIFCTSVNASRNLFACTESHWYFQVQTLFA